MTVTVTANYPAVLAQGATTYTLGGAIKGTAGDSLVQRATHIYAKACRRVVARAWPSGVATTSVSYITVWEGTFDFSADRLTLDVTGWCHKADVRLQVYESDGTTLQTSVTASFTDASAELLTLIISSGITAGACVLKLAIKTNATTATLYSFGIIERALTSGTLP